LVFGFPQFSLVKLFLYLLDMELQEILLACLNFLALTTKKPHDTVVAVDLHDFITFIFVDLRIFLWKGYSCSQTQGDFKADR
jgi:hypothetical protein